MIRQREKKYAIIGQPPALVVSTHAALVVSSLSTWHRVQASEAYRARAAPHSQIASPYVRVSTSRPFPDHDCGYDYRVIPVNDDLTTT